jgi:hypothetical protein
LYLVDPFVDTQIVIGLLIQAGVAGLAGVAVYILMMFLFKSEELASLWGKVKERIIV